MFLAYDESNTRKDLIMPLFRALGWDVFNDFNRREVIEEDSAVEGRVDYTFSINGIPKFLLEAKALRVDLDKDKWAIQAVTYGWNKGIPWVVLTDFEGLKLFSADWLIQTPQPSLEFTFEEYRTRFDDLWLLSRDSFECGELDKLATKWGITAKRAKVSEKLANDLMQWRGLLTKNFSQWNEKLPETVIDESVQRVLDRLIFIRVAEDRNLEQKILWQTLQKWLSRGRKPYNFMQELSPLFRRFDEKYDSSLFQPHACEQLETEGDPFEKIIKDLYADKEGGVKYRFDAIDSDVLGSIYEQYLGHVQQQLSKSKDSEKRKKQGIFYTPTHIVNYVVENTLGKALQRKSLKEIETIKILDPACGSGSFLIKAFDVLDNALKTKRQDDNRYDPIRKSEILSSNIYGVDLDKQAVEIARLNLLLKALTSDLKLPNLTKNIKEGNSLISKGKELEKPFDWKQEYKEVFDGGGFDVVIGNPPYIFARGGNFDKETKQYFYDNFQLASYQLNTFLLFIDRAYQLLKPGGYLGFIVPNTWLTIDTFSQLRKFLLEETSGLQIINIFDKVFGGANVDTCMLIFNKGKPKNAKLGEFRDGKLTIVGDFPVSQFKKNNYIINIALAKNKDKAAILDKIRKKAKTLSDFAITSTGLKAYQIGKGRPAQTTETTNSRIFHSNDKKNNTYKKYLGGRDVCRYYLGWSGEYLSYGDWLAEPRKSVPFNSPRILVRQIPSPPPYSINAVFTKEYFLNDINSMIVYDFRDVDPLFILAVLNSKATTFWFVNTFDKFQRKTFPQFKVKELATFPIPNAIDDQQSSLAKQAAEMMNLHQQLQSTLEHSDKYEALTVQVAQLNNEIDLKIYALYEFNQKEIEVIEKD